jgi:hypothetical protein
MFVVVDVSFALCPSNCNKLAQAVGPPDISILLLLDHRRWQNAAIARPAMGARKYCENLIEPYRSLRANFVGNSSTILKRQERLLRRENSSMPNLLSLRASYDAHSMACK